MKEQLLFCLLSAPWLFGCGLWESPMADPDCTSTPVQPDAELLITEPWLRSDVDAKNAEAGPFSFAGQLAALGQRYPSFDARTLWSLLEIDAGVPATELPFRLLALVNRSDLAEQLAPESPAGEARLVYTLTRGPGDDPASTALPLTLIFEYSLGSAHTVSDWSAAFHALGALSDSSNPTRTQGTSDLVRRFVSPTGMTGDPYLSQLRVNDARSGRAKLYELALDEFGKLTPRGLRNTPRSDLAGSPELSAFARENASAIAQGTHRIPESWLADSARIEPVTWLRTSPQLEHDFSRGTCPGCHGPDGPGDHGFHLTENAGGSVTLSRFLTEEELPRRTQHMRARLCQAQGGP